MKKIILLLFIFISLSSCNSNQDEPVYKNYQSQKVWSGSVVWKNSVVGYTKWFQQVMLATKNPGRVVYLAKNNGDTVVKWELLVNLDSAEASSWYATAANIESSLYALKWQTNKALDEQIFAMESKIESIKAWVSGAKTGLRDTKNITEKQINLAEVALETAQLNLEKSKKTLETQKENILSGAKTALVGSIILQENIMDFSDSLLWVTQDNRRKNDSFEEYLGIKDKNWYRASKRFFLEVQDDFNAFKSYYENFIEDKNPTEAELIEWLRLAEKSAEKQKILLADIYSVLENSVANVNFPEANIISYKGQASELWSNLESSLLSMSGDTALGIKWSIQNLGSFESEAEKWISLLEKQVELAQKSLDQYKAQAQGEINSVSTQSQVAELWLEEALAWLAALKAQKNASLSEIDSKIAEVAWSKSQAGVMIQNWKIIAPFSGIITAKMAEEWQVINAWMPLYELADNSQLKVTVFVSDEIYNELQLWDTLQVHIPGMWTEAVWTVSLLSQSLHPLSKKHEIELVLENPNKTLPIGAMVQVIFPENNIKEDKKENTNTYSIRIPNSAIVSRFMLPWVYVIEDNKAHFKNIEIIEMGEEYSQVSWLNLGEEIVTQWKENIYDGEILN